MYLPVNPKIKKREKRKTDLMKTHECHLGSPYNAPTCGLEGMCVWGGGVYSLGVVAWCGRRIVLRGVGVVCIVVKGKFYGWMLITPYTTQTAMYE